MELACVIPARLESSRFPEKLLVPLLDKRPLICHTVEKALRADCFAAVYCLTDSEEIRDQIRGLGVEVILTGPATNGTERIARHLDRIPQALLVNLQGDEPCFPPEDLRRFAQELKASPEQVHIMATLLGPEDTLARNSHHRVKVLFDSAYRVRDFKREILPRDLKPRVSGIHLGLQCGLYGYSVDFLRSYRETPPSMRELKESHEMLRPNPLPKIKVTLMGEKPPSVDVPEDLESVFRHLQEELHLKAIH